MNLKDNIKTPRPEHIHAAHLAHAWLWQELTDLGRGGIISPSTSGFASPVIIVPKQKDQPIHEITCRMVVNFRKKNKWTTQTLVLSTCGETDRIFLKLHGTRLFCTLDVRSNYYSITLAEDSRKHTMCTTEYGKYEFLRVFFGVHVAPSYFASMTNATLQGLDFCFAIWMTLSSTWRQENSILTILDILDIRPITGSQHHIETDLMWLL